MPQSIEQEKTVVSYLLGQLPDNTQEEVERRFFRDEVYHDFIRAVEDDLIDDYARDELDSDTRAQFEHRYLSSTERRQRVFFARAFVATLDETTAVQNARFEPEGERTSWWAAHLASLRVPGFALQGAMAVLLLGLLAAGVWMFIETRRLRARVAQTTEGVQQEERLRQQLADERQRHDDLEKKLQQLDTQNADEIDKLSEQLASSDEAAVRLRDELLRLKQSNRIPNGQRGTSSPALASFVLAPTTRDSSGPSRLSVPQNARAVKLQLKLNSGDDYPRYRVTMNGAQPTPVWSASNLRARGTDAGRTVSFNLPVKLLDENTPYELTLTGVSSSGATEVLGYYYFNLEKQ